MKINHWIQWGGVLACLLVLGGCQSSGTKTLTEETAPETKNINYDIALRKVTPNLKKKQVKVHFKIVPEDSVQIAVTDIGAVPVRTKKVSGQQTGHTLHLDGLRPGIYLISVIAPGGQQATQELLWQ